MIRKRPLSEIEKEVSFLYSLFMKTDYMIRLQMCGFTRLEAIMILDELSEDGEETLECYVEAVERERKDV